MSYRRKSAVLFLIFFSIVIAFRNYVIVIGKQPDASQAIKTAAEKDAARVN